MVLFIQERFARTEQLLGEKAMKKLKNSSVLLFGLGGVGSYTAQALARGGVGFITLVDCDEVNKTNIIRQLCAYESTLGEKKTQVVAKQIADINPECKVTVIEKFALPENLEEFEIKKYDFVADAIDTVSTKIALAQLAFEKDVNLISCMGTGNKLNPTAFKVGDIFETHTCPLCKVMRTELKKKGVKRLTVVWSDEEPIKPLKTPENENGKYAPASVSFVPGVAGLIMAGEIIKKLIGN